MKVRVASAGTGKTTSLVLRYLELLASGTPLRRIAGVTFTRVAADELRQRVGEGVSDVLTTGQYLSIPYLQNDAINQISHVESEDESTSAQATPSVKEDNADEMDAAGGSSTSSLAIFQEAKRELDGATLTTIHGFMIACLRLVAPHLSLDPDFSVLGEWEAQAIFEEELASLRYLAQDTSTPTTNNQQGEHALAPDFRILDAALATPTNDGSDAADTSLVQLFRQRSLSEQFEPTDGADNTALLAIYEQVYKRYRVRLGARLLPPSEIERWALIMVRSRPALARLAERYHVVLVDEFQDVNPVQGAFFRALEAANISIEVVGDPKQSIYGFRNADVGVFRKALAEGEVLSSLDQARRHSQVVLRLLNRVTSAFAERGWGFSELEAPDVSAAGPQAEVRGKVALHWVHGEAPIAELRKYEAWVLAKQLRELSHDYPVNKMAVLARSYDGLRHMEDALSREGLPYVLLQGRGYFERIEVRDLYHALRVGIEATLPSLAAWLRSPFAALDLVDVDQLLQADDPTGQLEVMFPEVYTRLEQIRLQVRANPVDALKFLIREPFIDGKRYIEFLDDRARENVDALLFTVAQQPPSSIEVLLERLEQLSRQADAGDVPQSGDGIALLTVHRAKGLEWDVLAVFDAGRATYHPVEPVIINTESLNLDAAKAGKGNIAKGRVSLRGSDSYNLARAHLKARNDQESFRLLYVALSRARDVLVVTGSSSKGRTSGWVSAFEALELGTSAVPYNRPDFVLNHHNFDAGVIPPVPPINTHSVREPSAWIDRQFVLNAYPPVFSPTGLKQSSEQHEKLPFNDPDEGERLPGAGRTVGTLVHYAIQQNWQPDNDTHMANLRAQEVMFPFTPSEQDELMADVGKLLSNYHSLLGEALPRLTSRSHDYPELAMALPLGTTVWQGIIDRFYCADEQWYLEDYKTDQEVRAEQYYPQLAFYKRAIEQVRDVSPRVQLVFLRANKVVEVAPQVLDEALEATLTLINTP
ncbi:MAG: UvrD-helicase domain-containing protein [Deinococcota bacterium]